METFLDKHGFTQEKSLMLFRAQTPRPWSPARPWCPPPLVSLHVTCIRVIHCSLLETSPWWPGPRIVNFTQHVCWRKENRTWRSPFSCRNSPTSLRLVLEVLGACSEFHPPQVCWSPSLCCSFCCYCLEKKQWGGRRSWSDLLRHSQREERGLSAWNSHTPHKVNCSFLTCIWVLLQFQWIKTRHSRIFRAEGDTSSWRGKEQSLANVPAGGILTNRLRSLRCCWSGKFKNHSLFSYWSVIYTLPKRTAQAWGQK